MDSCMERGADRQHAPLGASASAADLAALINRASAASGAVRMEALNNLRTAVSTLAVRLKDQGAPPERVLVAVKAAVGANRRGHAGATTDAREALVADVVRWCITAYYRGD